MNNLNTDELSLSELFAMADAIGNKYQTVEEISDYRQRLLAECADLSDEFPEYDDSIEDLVRWNEA